MIVTVDQLQYCNQTWNLVGLFELYIPADLGWGIFNFTDMTWFVCFDAYRNEQI